MKNPAEVQRLRWACLLLLFSFVPAAWAGGVYQHGTVVRMRMGACLPEHHTFMMAMSGGASPQNAPVACPEYTLLSEKVVYVIVGRSADQLIPLADEIDFRLQNTGIAVRVDDAKHESKFGIKEMILRSDWERVQHHVTAQLSAPSPKQENSPTLRTNY